MKLDVLFTLEYPPTLVFSEQMKDPNGVNFVSSSGKNNGVVSRVKYNLNNKLYKKGSITVPLKGSVLKAFVQPEDFYVAHQIAVLTPKRPMALAEKLYYCMCIRNNVYRFNYGRQADRSLRNLEIPDHVPNWVSKTVVSDPTNFSKSVYNKEIKLTDRNWHPFRYDFLFNIESGIGARRKDVSINGKTPLVTAIGVKNGLVGFVNKDPRHSGNVISVVRNGKSVGTAFYQPKPFCSTEDVHVFNPKNVPLNQYIAMFLITLIRKEGYRYNYGRKWGIGRMNETTIPLPVDKDSNPDWQFMEDYIKSLPYSSNL